MKKILACMSLVFALSAGATALANELNTSQVYDSSNNSLSITGAGATDKETILITNEDDTDILFVDQNDKGLGSVGSVTKFLLKGTDKLEEGTYIVKMHDTQTGETTTNTFKVVEGAPDTVNVLEAFKYGYINKHTQKNEYDAGFTATGQDLSNVRYIAITCTKGEVTKTVYRELGGTYNGTTNVAIRINNIPSDVTVSVALTATNGNAH